MVEKSKQKIQEKVEISKKLEMKQCTFTPNMRLSPEATNVHEKLFSERLSPKSVHDTRSSEDKQLLKCTFQPSIIKYKKQEENSNEIIPSYAKMVQRIRQANENNRKLKKQKEHIPAGENYFRLRSQPIQPFQLSQKIDKKTALFYLDVTLESGKRGRIAIHENDDINSVVQNFSKIFELNELQKSKLKLLLDHHIDSYLREQNL